MIEGDNTPPPPATDVQVTVRDGQTPQPGVTVVFQNLDGSLAAEMQTDASGLAKLDIPSANLTVIRTFPTPQGQTDPVPPEIYTYVGVKAGDRLVLGRVTDDHDTPSAVVVTVPDTANGTVRVQTSCGSGEGTPPSIPITVRSCGSSVALYVEDGNRNSAFMTAPYGENINAGALMLQQALGSTVTAINVQPNTTVTVEERLTASGFTFFSTGQKNVTQTAANVDLPQLGDGVEALLLGTIDNNGSTQIVASRAAYTNDTVSIDATAGLIATYSSRQDTPNGATWIEDGGATPDAVLGSFQVTPDPNGGRLPFIRKVIAAHTGAVLNAPMLLGTAAAYNFERGDSVNTSIGLVQATGGYDALRANAFAVESIVDAAPMNGRITLSYTGNRP